MPRCETNRFPAWIFPPLCCGCSLLPIHTREEARRDTTLRWHFNGGSAAPGEGGTARTQAKAASRSFWQGTQQREHPWVAAQNRLSFELTELGEVPYFTDPRWGSGSFRPRL